MGSNRLRLSSCLRKRQARMGCESNPTDVAILNMAVDPQSLFRRRAPVLSPGRENKTIDGDLRSLLSEANRDLAKLLRDVRTGSGGTALGDARSRQVSELLMRAVRCAAKQYMLQAELGNLALTDELTGLYNRRGFLALAERQLKLGRRSGRGILLVFLDVDGLKQINDTFGHAEGDRTLIRAGGVLEKTFRESDVVARFGGDEFAVLAIEASQHNQEIIAARLRENLRQMNDEDSGTAISLSWGVARFDPRSKTSIGQLMVQADQAMYDHKRCQSSSWENVAHPISN